jgi:hypothetical protein
MRMRLLGCVPVASPNFLKPTVALMSSRLRRPASLESKRLRHAFRRALTSCDGGFCALRPRLENRLNISIEMWGSPQT